MTRRVRIAMWLFVALLFSAPAAFHLEMRTWTLPQLDVQPRENDQGTPGGGGGSIDFMHDGSVRINGGHIDDTAIKIEQEMNSQINALNNSHQDDFTWAFYADVAAVIAALVSAAMEAFPSAEKRHAERGGNAEQGDQRNGEGQPIQEPDQTANEEASSGTAYPEDGRVDVVTSAPNDTPHPPAPSAS